MSSRSLFARSRSSKPHNPVWENEWALYAPVVDILRPAPVLLAPDDTIELARALLVDHGLHAAPVVSQAGQMLGVLTLRDCIDALGVEESDGDADERLSLSSSGVIYQLGPDYHVEGPLVLAVSDVMSDRVPYLAPSASIAHAAALMALEGFAQLFVVEAKILCGVVESEDIARWASEHSGAIVHLMGTLEEAGCWVR